jgi:putative transposase
MTTQNTKSTRRQQLPEEVVDRLAGLLPREELEEALEGLGPEQITGPGGLLTQLAGRVIETALGAELSEHLGYPPGQAPPGGAANVRNGAMSKTLQTDLGPVGIRTPRDRDSSFEPELVRKRQTRLAGLDDKVLGLYAGPVGIRTPRDRDSSFEPQLVRKRQTRLAGLDDKVLGLYAGGMSVRDIAAHLSELYGTEIGRDTVSRVTDAVLADVAAWRARPLEAVYPIVYFDALQVKVTEDRSVRNRACYLALGVTLEGEREVLGIWWQETEGAKFWLAVINDLHQRGVKDVLIACVDGLSGFPEAIEAVSPRPGCRPASSTRSGPRCATSTTATARPSPATCARSTPPPTPTPRSTSSRPSTASGAAATR